MGFIQKDNYFICNTILKENIKRITFNQKRITCIFSKNISDLKYKEITYINEKYRSMIMANQEIQQKISQDILE